MSTNGSQARQWLPPLEKFVRDLGVFQLQGTHGLRRESVETKKNAVGEESLVTYYDTESENRLRHYLRQNFPEHSILGEEGGNDTRDPDHYWILDPIDGTTNFAQGIPFWGPSVAYWYRGRAQLGIVYFPALDLFYSAIAGQGSRRNGSVIRSSKQPQYSLLTSVGLHSRFHLSHHLDLQAKVRVLGSFISNMCFVAQGTFVAAAGRGRVWDMAAANLILSEAGGEVDCEPKLESLDLSQYLEQVPGGRVYEVYGRANRLLQPLQDFVEDMPHD